MDLKPPLPYLYRVAGVLGARELGDTNQADGCHQVDETLRKADQGTDLPDWLQPPSVNGSDTCDVGIKLDGDAGAENVAHAADTGRI